MTGFLVAIFWIVFILSAIFLSAIVLLQEPKGGGLGEAFGGAGAEAFGVKSGGVTKLTGILAGVFLVSALCIGSCRESVYVPDTPAEEEADPSLENAVEIPVTDK